MIAPTSSSTRIGFEMYPFMPAAIHASRSPGRVLSLVVLVAYRHVRSSWDDGRVASVVLDAPSDARRLRPFGRPAPATLFGLLAATLVATCAAAAWPDTSPLSPRLGGRLAGDPYWTRLFFFCLVGAFVCYLLGLALVSRRASHLGVVAGIAVAIQLAPLGAPLLLSSDAWTYWDYGRIEVAHAGNPYLNDPSDFTADPAYRYVGSGWRDTTSVYGPAFTVASEQIAGVAGASADIAAWTYKAIAAVAALAATGLAAILSTRKVFAIAFVGWNPLLAIHFAGGGHNDVWMAALVLAALSLSAAGWRRAAPVAWGLAVFVKWIPLLFLPLRLFEARATGRKGEYRGLTVALLAIVALASLRYGDKWLSAIGPLAHNASQGSHFALPHRLTSIGVSHALTVVLFATLFIVGYAVLAHQAARGRARLGLAAVLALCATPYLVAWYTVWAVPLAAAEDDRLAQAASLILCAYLLRQAVPLK